MQDPSLLAEYAELLSSDEKEQHQRFVRASDRCQYLIARALVRTTLSKYAAVEPADWRFVCNEHGRPEIASPPSPLRFNLSHTAGMMVCAVISGSEDIGVDLEQVLRKVNLMTIAKRFFSAKELESLNILSGEERKECFFKYWTIKEAYLKARGQGMALPLDSVSVMVDQELLVEFDQLIEDDPAAWYFALLRPAENYTAALALRNQGRGISQIRCRQVEPLISERAMPAPIVLRQSLTSTAAPVITGNE